MWEGGTRVWRAGWNRGNRGWVLSLGWGGGGEAGQELNPSFTSIPGTPFSGAGPVLAEALLGTKKFHYSFSLSLQAGSGNGKGPEVLGNRGAISQRGT